MPDIKKTITVTLSNREICQALCDYVDKINCGDLNEFDPEKVFLVSGGKETYLFGTETITAELRS